MELPSKSIADRAKLFELEPEKFTKNTQIVGNYNDRKKAQKGNNETIASRKANPHTPPVWR